MRRLLIVVVLIVISLMMSCVEKEKTKGLIQPKTPYDYVNPFIGTDDMGHTFPGAALPFGMIQLSPDTDTTMYSYGKGYNPDAYRYCSGYQYSDSTIVGFSHTHFNGTGHSDLGDFLIMPTVGKVFLNPGTFDKPENGYRSRFSHNTEEAYPGFYSVVLQDYGIKARLSTSEHVGFHEYTFPETDSANIILDLTSGIYNYNGKVVWSSIRVENDTLITGFRQTNGWARTRYLFFAMVLSKPTNNYGLLNEEKLVYRGFWRKFNEDDNFPERAGHKIKAYFQFKTELDEKIKIKFALSGVSTKNALENLKTEIPHWDFSKVEKEAKDKWNEELSKITIEADEEKKVNFYTSMYHSFLNPIVFSDVNGDYRGLDQNIYNSKDSKNYTIFSLWDTYRALHPLYTIIQQGRTNDIVQSMLDHYDQSVHKILPVWSHYANENWCMIGYHAVPVIVDAYHKGIRGYDINKAYEAVIASANYNTYDGIGYYKKFGYVPEDLIPNSASKTLEYAYDDYAIYSFAEDLGKQETADSFKERAGYYKNLYDKNSGFIRAKNSNGSWKTPFDPMSVAGQGFIEGNAWNYSLYVPHDTKGFINLLGGEQKLINWLDSLFVMEVSDDDIAHSEDVTKVGMIGNYVHGNEPSHHVPYLYCYTGQPWKTQEKIHQIMESMYRNAPDGLSGNDDCGQMSAWYIFSSLGFYPVCPGSNEYVFGSPSITKAEINLENGKKFVIEAKNLDSENIYIQSITLNGKDYKYGFIKHADIIKGGRLIFKMGSEPNYSLTFENQYLPYSMTK